MYSLSSQEHKVLLTGTPLQNNVEELYSLLNFLEPARFSNEELFMLEFSDLKSEGQVSKLKQVSTAICLQVFVTSLTVDFDFLQILKPMMLRRLKEDVEKSIAAKEETIIEVQSACKFHWEQCVCCDSHGRLLPCFWW